MLGDLVYPYPSGPHITAMMRANKRADTKPEAAIRSALHAHGHRFRKDYFVKTDHASVHVDIAFPRRRLAVFVDGCFWHCCPDHYQVPTANRQYWEPKLARNVARDTLVNRSLAAAGWNVVRLWEHSPVEAAVANVETALSGRSVPAKGLRLE